MALRKLKLVSFERRESSGHVDIKKIVIWPFYEAVEKEIQKHDIFKKKINFFEFEKMGILHSIVTPFLSNLETWFLNYWKEKEMEIILVKKSMPLSSLVHE